MTRALRQSEEKYRLVVDNANEAIVVAQAGFIRFANPVAIAMTGYDEKEYYATAFLNLVHPDDRARVAANYARRVAGEPAENNYAFRIVTRLGDVRWLHINAVPIEWEGRAATLNFLSDITERERLQENLRQTLIEREAILQSSVVGIVFTKDRVIRWINRTLEQQMLGYGEGELVGQGTAACYTSDEDYSELGRRAYQEIAEGRTWSCEMRMRRRDGSLFWCHETGKAVDPDDLAQGAIWVMTDVTRRREAEEELRKALEQERELSELKSRFVSMTSHEFRTPLATILSATELMEKYGERLPASEKAELTELVKTAVSRMTNMLDDVLLIGKADAGRVEFHPRLLDVRSLAESVVEEIARPLDGHCRLQLAAEGESDPRLMDEKLVRHILSNLLSNAVKYSPAGGQVDLRLRCGRTETTFEVKDAGIGIPKEDQGRLFSTFHRGRNVSNISGTGLGLAIVKKCVDVHGGSISFESEVGRGSTFVVRIPQREGP